MEFKMQNSIKLSDYVADFLSTITDYAFVGQGSCVVHILDSIDKRDDIKNIPSQNEQGASLAADAYSRSSGKMGVSIATSGPGIINLIQGIGCSFFDSIPHLIISGAVPTNQTRINKEIRQVGFQEMEVVDIVKPLTKYAVLLKDANKIKYELEKLIYYSKEGRCGPVLLDLPDDLQREFIIPDELESFIPPDDKNYISSSLDEVLNLINNSKRPLIIYGNGIKVGKAEVELDVFLKKTNIPFVPTWATLDLYDYDTENLVGTFGVAASRYGNFAVQKADLLICIGTRLSYQLTGAQKTKFSPNSKKIIVEIEKVELENENGIKADIGINSCAKIFLQNINKSEININNIEIEKWKEWINSVKKEFPICKKSYHQETKFVNPYVFFDTLSNFLKKDDVVIPDASANLIWAYQALKPKKGQQIFTALNHSPMGYSVAASVGAQFSDFNKRVIAVIGDGSMQMNVQELETISYNKLPIKIFIINNEGYGLIKGTQEGFLNKNYVGVDKTSGLGIPDFKKIAYAYDIQYQKISNNNDLKEIFNNLLDENKPIIFDVMVDPEQRVLPKLESGKLLHDMAPYIDRNILDQIMEI